MNGQSPEGRLRQAIKAKRVIVVVGAGVSIGATLLDSGDQHPCASWTGLIENGIAALTNQLSAGSSFVTSARSMLKEKRLEAAADQIYDGLGPLYSSWLRRCFETSSFPITNDAVPNALHRLGLPILTTNYDDILERASPRNTLVWSNAEAWSLAKDYPNQYVLHIHGSYTDSNSVIFGKDSYQTLLRDAPSQAFWEILGHQYPILGLGGSFDDLNFQRLQTYLTEILKKAGPEHYRLVHTGQPDIWDKKFTEQKISSVNYGQTTAELAGFLQELAPSQAIETTVQAKPPTEAVLNVQVEQRKVTAILTVGARKEGQAEQTRGLTNTTLETLWLLDQWVRDDPVQFPGDALGRREDDRRDIQRRAVQQIGKLLFEAVFFGDVGDLYQQARYPRDPAKQVPLAIKLLVPRAQVPLFDDDQYFIDLRDLPWELLWDEQSSDGYLSSAPGVTLARVAATPDRSAPRIPFQPRDQLTILVALAQPESLVCEVRSAWPGKPNYDDVIAGISAAIGTTEPPTNGGGTFRARIRPMFLNRPEPTEPANGDPDRRSPVTWERFQAKFLPPPDAPSQKPEHVDVVHFIAHSGVSTARRQGYIAFEVAKQPGDGDGQTGEVDWVRFEEIVEFFRELDDVDRPTLIVLHLCRGLAGSVVGPDGYDMDLSRASFSQLGRLLMEARVPLVVAMQYPMWPDVGQEFTRAFYRQVDSMTVAQAVQGARHTITRTVTANLGKRSAGSVGPILFMASGVRQILSPRPTEDSLGQPTHRGDSANPERTGFRSGEYPESNVAKQRPAAESDRHSNTDSAPVKPDPIGVTRDGE